VKILITGTRGLALALGNAYADHTTTLVSKSNGFDINNIEQWGIEFLDYDCVFNCAYDGFAQVGVLEFFYQHWKHDHNKKIVTIGSRVVTHKRSQSEDGYWPYRLHKQALQQAHDAMLGDTCCGMTIVHPGPVDTDMIQHLDVVKMNPNDLAITIKNIVELGTIKRVDLWQI
jgi:hypothetical protein